MQVQREKHDLVVSEQRDALRQALEEAQSHQDSAKALRQELRDVRSTLSTLQQSVAQHEQGLARLAARVHEEGLRRDEEGAAICCSIKATDAAATQHTLSLAKLRGSHEDMRKDLAANIAATSSNAKAISSAASQHDQFSSGIVGLRGSHEDMRKDLAANIANIVQLRSSHEVMRKDLAANVAATSSNTKASDTSRIQGRHDDHEERIRSREERTPSGFGGDANVRGGGPRDRWRDNASGFSGDANERGGGSRDRWRDNASGFGDAHQEGFDDYY